MYLTAVVMTKKAAAHSDKLKRNAISLNDNPVRSSCSVAIMVLSSLLVVAVFAIIGACQVVSQDTHFSTTGFINPSSEKNTTLCPVWSVSPTNCTCGASLNNLIRCSKNTVQIQQCLCMYFDETLNTTFVGNCLYTCFHHNSVHSHHGPAGYVNFDRLRNGSKFNQDMCLDNPVSGNMHRQGRFCGECEEGYGLAAYSYHFIHCINCTDYGYKNWLKYFAIAYLPLTVFYFVVITFRIRVTTPPMNSVVLICQFLTLPVMMHILAASDATESGDAKPKQTAIAVLTAACGVWNLDFFRSFNIPFCLHPRFGALQIVALDYLIAVYPLLLIFLTYILLKLYDRNCRVLVWMWRPFKWFFSRTAHEWNLQASLVDGFNSFLIMSYVKLLSVSCILLFPTRLYGVNGKAYTQHSYLYYDATVELFSEEHLPYAILAFVMGLVLVVLPLVLVCLYPCRCFQKLLNCCGLSCQALHIFMDSFLGCYKVAPIDCRYFAGFFLILRITFVLSVFLIPSPFVFALLALSWTIVGAAIIVAQPYQQRSSNTVDAVLLLSLAVFGITLLGGFISDTIARQSTVLSTCFELMALLFIIVSFLALLINCICKPRAFPRRILQACWGSFAQRLALNRAGSLDSILDGEGLEREAAQSDSIHH